MKSDHVHSVASHVLRGAAVLIGAAVWLLLSPQLVQGAELSVDCSNPKAKVKTITAALAQLNKTVENTVTVSGACTEWVRIRNFENLTLTANSGASISAPTTPSPDGYAIPLFVYESGTVIVKGFTINGREIDQACVACAQTRYCSLENNTIQGGDIGVQASSNTNLYLMEDTIQENAYLGVYVTREVSAAIFGGTIQRNEGGIDVRASTLTFLQGISSGSPVTVQDNLGSGVSASLNSSVTVTRGAGAIMSNGDSGINLAQGSVADIHQDNVITGGTRGAVVIGDLSLANFRPHSTISGGPPSVNCVGKYSVASGPGLVGIDTNCPQ